MDEGASAPNSPRPSATKAAVVAAPDKENPPPKVVQGYKFNIFYPDLIDKTKAPTYTVHEFKPDPAYSIITFKAGPPYEDIAFKIVQKKWEYGHKRGFKCKFERGVLYLYFNFQRVRYRR